MKRKLLLTLTLAVMLICVFAISVGAKELERYCDVKLTFTDNTEATAYFEIYSWGNMWVIGRDTIYITTNTDNGTYSWENVKVVDFRDFNYTDYNEPATQCSVPKSWLEYKKDVSSKQTKTQKEE